MKKVISLLLITPLLAAAVIPLHAIAEEPEAPATEPTDIIISEIKLGESKSTTEEPIRQFVTIFNQGDQDIDLSSWKLEYAKEAFGGSCEQPAPWADDTAGQETLFDETIIEAGAVISIERSLNDSESGSLRLTEMILSGVSFVTHDVVGWGNNAPCFEGSPAQLPANGESIARYLDCVNNLPVDTNDNGVDFFISQEPSYSALGGMPLESCESDEEDDELPDDQDPPGETLTCEGVMISEVLPNAAGSDVGNEFIELYNPTADFIFLDGCGLSVNSDDTYLFEDGIELEPEQYRAFYDDQTGLTMPNAAGGTVYLLSPDEEELHEVTYAPDLDDDVSWAWVKNELWEQTYKPTPNSMNIRQPLKPCPEGQVRNPDTNRCNSTVAGESTLKPCGEGRERNPETNRCRNIDGGYTPKPCDPDQERNPETNRCRKVAGTSDLKPCDANQERNPETNRCRKIASANTSAIPDVHDIQAVTEGSPYRWWIAGSAVAAVLAYGIFEWRRDIISWLGKLKR